ncbi:MULTISPECIES: CydX/CbdX family cytochrome bd oxidase small subunit [Testudinibacter]|uniref:Cyd operon protein YbgT n=1 Tax=Testudinibacter aquarius TaxID=1524974 RepID=A0A4R3Y6I0_9PAST|nr:MULTISPECIES: CydX/CbdX family cytochrome bd oxidase small subunit [Testudinibacter]TNG95107.1 cytochrome bd oxidase small subunit, CydX/CbdX family [Pasteurellaceae bacterium UScroc12]TNG96438.1 cytochrome bd oxidase small subunit, CydX/CbdX family [Pasteurellaceae bacterium USgator41]TNG99925.1 cytochrome bd oxidase small subunit, CydX/CbdX family [Pasteurellaceae bacterium UScroc31]TNH01635.1 cytochrome bd oxidase small subunit, CydX/CbdX family [Pasteurellaceae bacterium USgator11]TNH04
MFYIAWVLGVLLAVFFAAIVTISIEKTGKFDE